jgi:hypothetical protein
MRNEHAWLMLAFVVLSGVIAGSAGATGTITVKKERPIALTLGGTTPWTTFPDTTGSFTGTIGKQTVSGTYTGRFLYAPGAPDCIASAISCVTGVYGSFTFIFAGKEGSFRASVVDPGGNAVTDSSALHQQWSWSADLEIASGTRSYSSTRGGFHLQYTHTLDQYTPSPGFETPIETLTGTLHGVIR